MTAKTPKRMIRVPDPSIRGTRPPPRTVPGGGIPPGSTTPPRPVEGGGLSAPAHPPVLPPPPLPPLLPRQIAGNGQPAAAPAAAPTPLGRMKNAELRGKIARLERENRILAERVAELTLQLQEALK